MPQGVDVCYIYAGSLSNLVLFAKPIGGHPIFFAFFIPSSLLQLIQIHNFGNAPPPPSQLDTQRIL